MGWKAVASVILSVVSIVVHTGGLSFASSAAATMAQFGRMNRSLATVSGAASALAIVLAVLALPLAINSWSKERRANSRPALGTCGSIVVVDRRLVEGLAPNTPRKPSGFNSNKKK